MMAVFTSRSQVLAVHDGTLAAPTTSAARAALLVEVLDWLPDDPTIDAATARALSYIPDAVRDIAPLIAARLPMLRSRIPSGLSRALVEPLLRPIVSPLIPPPRGAPPPPPGSEWHYQFRLDF